MVLFGFVFDFYCLFSFLLMKCQWLRGHLWPLGIKRSLQSFCITLSESARYPISWLVRVISGILFPVLRCFPGQHYHHPETRGDWSENRKQKGQCFQHWLKTWKKSGGKYLWNFWSRLEPVGSLGVSVESCSRCPTIQKTKQNKIV